MSRPPATAGQQRCVEKHAIREYSVSVVPNQQYYSTMAYEPSPSGSQNS